MKTRFLLVLALLLAPRPARAAATLELYGNMHTMGITLTLAPGDDPDQDAVASVEYRISGAGPYRLGFPLSRVGATRFVGSLFRLVPGLWHAIPITISAAVSPTPRASICWWAERTRICHWCSRIDRTILLVAERRRSGNRA